MGAACAICGGAPAPFGLGLPGFAYEKPAGRRGYVWHCGRDGCRAEVEARRARKAGTAAPPRPAAQPALFAAPPGAQPDLWGR